MKRLIALSAGLALATPGFAASEPGPTDAPTPGFDRLWTGWSRISRESLEREQAEAEQRRRDVAAADARRLQVMRQQGRSLGERVGEIVRAGDCAEGERVASEAGDFALVAAVRAHCRAIPAAARLPQR